MATQNPTGALKRARARARQAERDARRMRDRRRRWEAEGTRLTRAEFEAGYRAGDAENHGSTALATGPRCSR